MNAIGEPDDDRQFLDQLIKLGAGLQLPRVDQTPKLILDFIEMSQVAWRTDRQDVQGTVFRSFAYRENAQPIRVSLVLAQQRFIQCVCGEKIATFHNRKNLKAG